jgi:hypothetical protein
VNLSYDPPEQSLAEIMSETLDEVEGTISDDPAQDAAEALHEKLLLNGQRHHLEVDQCAGQVVLRIPPGTALWLADLATEAWRARGT